MAGNKGICHSCTKAGHFLSDCPTKKQCPKCGNGIEKCMEVQKNSSNVGRLFFCCTRDCGHFAWKDEEDSSGESNKGEAIEGVEDLSSMLEACAKITEKRNVEITVNITFRKGKGVAEDEGKERGKA